MGAKEEMEHKAPQVAATHSANLFAQIHLHYFTLYNKSRSKVGSFVECMG